MRFSVAAAIALVALSPPAVGSDWTDSPYGAFVGGFHAAQERHDTSRLVDICERLCRSNDPSCGRCISIVSGRIEQRRQEMSDADLKRRLDEAESGVKRLSDCMNPLSLNRLDCQARPPLK